MNKHTRWNINIIMLSLLLSMSCGFTSCDDEAEVDYGILLAVPNDAGVIVKASDLCA